MLTSSVKKSERFKASIYYRILVGTDISRLLTSRYTMVCFSLSLSTRALVDCSASDFFSAVACFIWSDRFASLDVSAAHYLRPP
eukprot:scaffold141330_cov52-Attheya_sp.AAC.2